jgi:hypothetical protein
MSDQVIIPGETDEWSRHKIPAFVIGERHTVFEWCWIYVDRNPAMAATGFLGRDSKGCGYDDMKWRLSLLCVTGSGPRDAYGNPMGPQNYPLE